MATSPRIHFRPVRSLSGLPYPAENFPEGITSTFKVGCLVYMSAGYLVTCSTNPTLIMGVASRAGQNGAANGTYAQLVWLAHPDTLFMGNYDTGGSEGNGVTALANRGRTCGVTMVTSSHWYVDYNKVNADTRVIVWEHWLQDGEAIGDTLGRVIFSFSIKYFQGGYTS